MLRLPTPAERSGQFPSPSWLSSVAVRGRGGGRGGEYLRVKDFLPLGGQVVLNAVDGSIQGDATDEQDGENNVRESSREIHHLRTRSHSHVHTQRLVKYLPRVHVCSHVGEYLARGLNAPEETEEDHDPGDGQAAQDGQMHFSEVPNIIRDVQDIVPEMTH